MLKAPIRQFRAVSKVTTRPAPVKGLNSYDSIVGMPEGYALLLKNWFAQPYGCQVRRGYRRHVDGLPGYVETLMSHNTSPAKLYAAVSGVVGSSIYDVTTPGADPEVKKTELANARWQHINFANVAGVHMAAVNGADNMMWFQPDGTVTEIYAGDGTTPNTIGGVDPVDLIDIYSHQKRIWFVEKDSTIAWYLPPDQIYGVATLFNPGLNWTRGGYLTQIITWTIDDGNGADDHLAFISSEGEISIYQGTDPSSIETWSMQGVYFAGAPVGRRAATRYGGDIKIITQLGIVNLSDLLKSTKVNPTEGNDSKYIQQLVSAAVTETGHIFGWQPFMFPAANMVIINVPATESTSVQFVMNDITKAWSQFFGYNAKCWELHSQLPFFGSLGAVYRAWEGNTDDSVIEADGSETLGAEIFAEVQTTFSYFETLGQQKHFKMVRPTILSRGTFALSLSVNVDFVFDTPLAPTAFPFRKSGYWDKDYWDAATWAGGLGTNKAWQAVTGIGTAASLRMIIRTASETYWPSTDWLLEVGGVM